MEEELNEEHQTDMNKEGIIMKLKWNPRTEGEESNFFFEENKNLIKTFCI